MTRNPSENNRTERNRGAFRRTLRFKPLEDRSLLSGIDFTGVPQWVPQGPAPIYQDEGTVKETQVAGAIEAIVVHPTDENILYVATVNGGIWKTTNATYSRLDGIDNDGDGKKDEQDDDEVPSWTPLTDDLPGLSQGAMGATRDLPGLSMGAIAIDPLDYDTVYAGNARASSTNKGASRGGLLRSEDAGLHWTELGETDFPGRNVRRIVPTTMTGPGGQVILVAASERETPTGTARGGIFRSEDTGTYWKLLSTIDGLSSRTATDLIVDPGDATRFYAAFSRDGVYRSLAGSDGASWQSMNTGLPLTGSTRILLAGHAGGTPATNVVYAAVLREQSGSDLVGVFRRTDDDAAWSAVGTPPNTGNHPNLHFAIIADPDDENTVIVGGQYGNYRFDAETGNWEHLVEGLVDDTATHADHRSFAYDHNNNLLDANDGGIFRLVNPNGVIGLDRKYESLNGNLQITEINWNSSVGYDSLHDIIIAGTQDNGSIEQNVTGSPEYTHSAGGDGNTVAVGIGGPSGDRYADRYLMGNTHVTKFIRKRYNTFEEQPVYVGNVMLADSDTPDDRFSGLTVGNDAKATAYSPGIQFVTNTQEPSRVLLGRKGLYESDDFGDTVRDITAGGMVSGKFKTLVYGAAGNEDLIYAGGHRYASEMKPPGEEDHAMWVRQSGDGPPVRAVAYPPVINLGRASIKATLPRAIAVDPDDWQTAYVLDEDSHIWRTTDAGASWTAELTEKLVVDASGTESVLRSLPSGSSGLWDIELVRVGGTPVLLAAGEGGVYRRINPHLGDNVSSWTEVGRGLPNALVMALHYDSDANLLIAGTIGRGIWTIPHADAYLASAGIMTINGDQAFEGQNDTIRLALNETNPILLDVFLGCGNTPSYSVEFAAVQGIVINGLAGDDYIKIDSLPPLTRLTINGGAGDDVIHIASNDVESIVLIDGNGGSDRFDVAPNKFFSIHVDGGGPASPGDTLNVLAEGRPASIFWSGPEEGAVGVEDPPDDFQLIRFSGFGPAAIQTDGPLYPLDDWDERGPNEGFAQASDLVGGAQIQAELTIHEAGDEDWYKWTASADGWLLVTTRFCNAVGNLDLQLADSFRILLDSSTSTTDDEQVSWDVKAGQTYFIRVFGVGGATNYDYTLRIHWQGGIPPDDLEPNDSCLDGYPLESGDQTLTGLTIEKTGEFSSDDDWFRWTASETGWLTVDLLFLHRLGDLNLELHILPSDVKVVSESTTDDERVSWWVTAGESYCIRVYGFVGWAHPSYDLVLDGPEIAPGVSEGNDSFDEAFDLVTGDRAIRGLTIHQAGDEDWFQWNATDKGTLIVDTRFIHDLGNLDLELYDSDRTLLASSSSTTDDEQVSWKVAVGQTYYIRVFGVGGAVNREYTLELDWPFDTPQDRFEPNDRFGQAFDFGEGDQRYTGLTIHEIPGGEFVSNEDWYKWTASGDGALTVNVHFLHALGDVNLELYETSQARLAFSNSTTNDEQVSWWEVEDGRTYYIRVFGFTGANHPDYDLVIDGPDVSSDLFEPNNSLAQAFDVGMADQYHAGLTLDVLSNEDWYQWTAPTQGALTVNVRFRHSRGNVDLELWDETGVLLDASTSTTDNEQVSWDPVQSGQSYFIRVFGFRGDTHPDYGLQIDGPDVLPDAFEPNDGFPEAADVGTGSQLLPALTIHESDNSDWYLWTASQRGLLTVDVRFDHALGDLDLELYDADARLLASSVSTTDGEQVSSAVEAGQSYFIHAFGAGITLLPTGLLGARSSIFVGALQRHYEMAISVSAGVVGRHVFYNDSAFDGNNPAPNANDHNAVATDKVALLPGQTATLANYTSYSRGINGIMIDIANLTRNNAFPDFDFKVGNDDDPAGWEDAPLPGSISLWPGAGALNSDRVMIIWPDNAIQNQWLQVTVRPGGNTGVIEPDVFYFGNAVAEAGDSATDGKVTTTDLLLARNNPRGQITSPAEITFPYDFDRDGQVNATDVLLARNNRTSFFNALKLIDLSDVEEVGGEGEELAGEALAWLGDAELAREDPRQRQRSGAAEEAVDKLLAMLWE